MTMFESASNGGEVRRNNVEPMWMPGLDEVVRARVQLERRGVVRSLARGVVDEELVSAGETPWPWWVLAALWIVLWPAAIALKAGGGAAWLPWWLAITLPILHLLALAGPVAWTERNASSKELRRRFGAVRSLAQLLALEPDEFENWSAMLFTLMGFEVRNTPLSGDHGIDLVVTSDQIPTGLVQCKRYRGTVGEAMVRDLFGAMTHESAAMGWLATTGSFSRHARAWAEGKPIELWDGLKLVELARRYR